jgi:UDP-glucose 4-epimerase
MYFRWHNDFGAESPSNLVIVVGSGLIGSAILNKIGELPASHYNTKPPPKNYQLSWMGRLQFDRDLTIIKSEMLGHFLNAQKIEVVWSAGKAGFSSSEQEARKELSYFEIGLDWFEQLQALSGAELNISLISSLGGLFEDIGVVDTSSKPQPIRAYGRMKLEQEQILISSCNKLGKKIYRVSSAYGFVSHQHRMGLIPTLINDAQANRPTCLTGRLETQRDYVWAGDVAKYLVDDFGSNNQYSPVSIASFRSYSISEIKEKIEACLNKHIKLVQTEKPDNAKSIVICPSLRPENYAVSAINRNISLIAQKLPVLL